MSPAPTTIPPSIFTPYLSPSLSSHLKNLPSTKSLDSLSRTPLPRLQRTALPNIGTIELVSSEDFDSLYDQLYVASFPHRTERERSDLIVERLAAQAKGHRQGLAPYRIVGIRDRNGEVVGAAQFSVLPVPPRKRRNDSRITHGSTLNSYARNEENSSFRFAVPYLQYIYVRAQNRRQDMSEVLHTMVLAVASADAAILDLEDQDTSDPSSEHVDTTTTRTVPFTLFETEPPDHGADETSRAYAHERSKIHTSSGGMALILRLRQDQGGEDEILSAHVQPGLEHDDPPLTLVWMIRPSPSSSASPCQSPMATTTPNRDYNLTALGKALISAYYQSLRDEGFPEKNIRLAERILEARYKGSEFEMVPLAEVRDFKMEEGILDLDEKV